ERATARRGEKFREQFGVLVGVLERRNDGSVLVLRDAYQQRVGLSGLRRRLGRGTRLVFEAAGISSGVVGLDDGLHRGREFAFAAQFLKRCRPSELGGQITGIPRERRVDAIKLAKEGGLGIG